LNGKQITPEKFQAVFGAPMEKASELVAAKTLTINKLLALCPPGTIDPTPHLYDTTMYTLSGMMVVAFLAHGLVKPYKSPVSVVNSTATEAKVEKVEVVEEKKEEVVGDRQVK